MLIFEWFIGHAGSTYYRTTEAEKLELFKKIEPYLTYLDYSGLEAKAADYQTQLDDKGDEIQRLKEQLRSYQSEITEWRKGQEETQKMRDDIDKLIRDMESTKRKAELFDNMIDRQKDGIVCRKL